MPAKIKDGGKEIGAGIIVYRRSPEGLKYLLLYKSRNYWNFPRGSVESEERSFYAALRETYEETKLGAKDLRVVPQFRVYEKFRFRRGGKSILKIVILYLAETNKREIPLSTEHQGYAWLSYAEAQKFLGTFKSNIRPLKKAHAFLGRKYSPSRGEQKKN